MIVIDIEDWFREWIVKQEKFDFATIIGRGKDAKKYQYKSPVFTINSALEFYPSSDYTVMIQAHFKELKDLPLFKDSTVIYISRKYVLKKGLIPGCTPSIFLSFLIKNIDIEGTIYLQGFSMDEERNLSFPSPLKSSQVYDWNRQVEAFGKCQALAHEKKIKLIIIDENKKLPFIKCAIPKKEHLKNG